MNEEQLKTYRTYLWGIASAIMDLDGSELEEFETFLHKGPDTPIADTALIKIARITRKVRHSLIPVEDQLRNSLSFSQQARAGSAFDNVDQADRPAKEQTDIFATTEAK